MKFSAYEPQVGLNTVSARVQAPGNVSSYGGGEGYAALGKGFGVMAARMERQRAADDEAAVLDAANAANADMINYFAGEKGLLSRQGVNAAGSFAEAQKYVNNLTQKYSEKLGSGRRAAMFKAKFNPNAFNYLRSAGTHERVQRQKADATRFDTAMANNATGILLNYNDYEATDTLIRDMSDMVEYRGNQLGLDKDTILLNKRAYATKSLEGAVNDAIGKENYSSAENLLLHYKDIMLPEVYAKLNNKVTDVRMDKEYRKTAYSIVDSCIDENGFVDTAKMAKRIDEDFGPANDVTEGILPYSLPISEGDSPDLRGLNGNLRKSIDLVGGILHQLGVSDNAMITSGYRDAQHNAEVGGATNSYHTRGNAIDISLGNIGKDEQERVKKAFQPYFGEVLYHDAGSGVHLHLGDYQNNLNAESTIYGPFNAKQYDKVKQLASARANDINNAQRAKNIAYKRGILMSAISSSNEEATNIINNAKLSPEEKIKLVKEVNELNNPDSYKVMNPVDKEWLEYIKSGNYQKDEEMMAEYRQRAMDSSDIISDKDQQRYNKAARKLNMYYAYANAGYQTRDYNQDYSNRVGYNEILDIMEVMAESGLSKEEISKRLRVVVPEYGMDPEYFINNAPWDKLGPEGVK